MSFMQGNKLVRIVIANALMNMSEELRQGVIKHNCYCTVIEEDVGVPVTVNGIVRPTEPNNYVIIDTTIRQLFDYDSHVYRARALYNMFDSINKWYRC